MYATQVALERPFLNTDARSFTEARQLSCPWQNYITIRIFTTLKSGDHASRKRSGSLANLDNPRDTVGAGQPAPYTVNLNKDITWEKRSDAPFNALISPNNHALSILGNITLTALSPDIIHGEGLLSWL